jgi:hypothetical protein
METQKRGQLLIIGMLVIMLVFFIFEFPLAAYYVPLFGLLQGFYFVIKTK